MPLPVTTAKLPVSAECTCCLTDLDIHVGNNSKHQDEQKHQQETVIRTDGQIECFPACEACCHLFHHQHCTAACDAHIHPESNESSSLNLGSSHTSSTNSLSDVNNKVNDNNPLHASTHHHDVLRYRAAYRPPPASKDIDHQPADGVKNEHGEKEESASVIGRLSFIDRFLSVWIILVMIIGVLVGYYSSSAQQALNSVDITTVSLPVAFGLWFMMYPVLVKVKYESFGAIFRKRDTFRQLAFSILANWVSKHRHRAHIHSQAATFVTPDIYECLLYICC